MRVGSNSSKMVECGSVMQICGYSVIHYLAGEAESYFQRIMMVWTFAQTASITFYEGLDLVLSLIYIILSQDRRTQQKIIQIQIIIFKYLVHQKLYWRYYFSFLSEFLGIDVTLVVSEASSSFPVKIVHKNLTGAVEHY